MKWYVVIIITGICACKNPTAQVKTQEESLYQALYVLYSQFVIESGGKDLDWIVGLEKDFCESLNNCWEEDEDSRVLRIKKAPAVPEQFSEEQRDALLQMQHHMRSIIAYAAQSRCFVSPSSSPRSTPRHQFERRWQDRFNYNYYKKGGKRNALVIDNNRLCSFFWRQLKELTFEQIDLSRPNAEFFARALYDRVPSYTTEKLREEQQKFFKEALAPQIADITEQSMARTEFLFPFQHYDYYRACVEERDHYKHTGKGSKVHRYPAAVRAEIDCRKLQQLSQVKMNKHRKVDCANIDYSSGTIEPKPDNEPFPNLKALLATIQATIDAMNTARAELDRLVNVREIDAIKTTEAREKAARMARAARVKNGARTPHIPHPTYDPENIVIYKNPHVKKKKWLFWNILNATDVDGGHEVAKAIDTYQCHFIAALKRGTLPLLFARATQKETGSVHLNHAGRFFGFGKVQYKPLQQPTADTLQRALHELQQELVSNWVAMQANRVDSKAVSPHTIYTTIINNEFAVAQLLLQNPTHTTVVDSLLRKFKDDQTTPEWLRRYKRFALWTELGLLVSILLTGGAAAPLLVAGAMANFLWVGGAAAEQVVARNRYRLLERSLLTGNSEQVARGQQLLDAMHTKRRDFIVSGAIGAPLTVGGFTLTVKSIRPLISTPVDVTAGLTAEVEFIAGDEDEPIRTSDEILDNERQQD